MNQWMQKQPIQGADLKEGDGGGGDVCACVCVCSGCGGGGGGGCNNAFFSCQQWWTSKDLIKQSRP